MSSVRQQLKELTYNEIKEALPPAFASRKYIQIIESGIRAQVPAFRGTKKDRHCQRLMEQGYVRLLYGLTSTEFNFYALTAPTVNMLMNKKTQRL